MELVQEQKLPKTVTHWFLIVLLTVLFISLSTANLKEASIAFTIVYFIVGLVVPLGSAYICGKISKKWNENIILSLWLGALIGPIAVLGYVILHFIKRREEKSKPKKQR